MRRMLWALLVGVLVVGQIRAEEKGEKIGKAEPDTFIDEKLSGWEGLTKEYWSYKKGELVGKHEGLKFNTFLCSKKKYGDFELKFKVRLKDAKGNSGIQVRSKLTDMKKFTVIGPQCDIGQGFWGSLYGEGIGGMIKASPKDFVKKHVKEKEFNDYYIKVVGKKVTIKVNGETAVDGEFDKVPAEGIIAFQIHAGGAMEVTFKDIVFKDLSKKKEK